MQKLALFVAFFALGCPAWAAPAQEVLFKPKAVFPAQGGPAAKIAFIGDKSAVLVGGIGSVSLGGGLGLGVGSYSLSSELTVEKAGVVRDVGVSYVGALIENSFFQRRLFYFNLSSMLALGQAHSVARMAGAQQETAMFFLVEPGFNTMLNVTPELRVGLGVGYRMTAGADLNQSIGLPMHGFSAAFTLYYGKL
jgi:hypothetical protein